VADDTTPLAGDEALANRPGDCPSPRISIVTLSFNQGRFLAQAMESVLMQDYGDVEYIVVDPGSTDGSRDIIRRYASRCSHVVFEKDRGPAEGLNNGFRRATGDYFGFLNADDVLLPGALSTVAAVARDTHADVMSGHCYVVDAEGRRLRRAYSDAFSLEATAYGVCVLMQPSTVFRAACFRNIGGFNAENMTHWDGELFADMALVGARFTVVQEFLSAFRLHRDSISASAVSRQRTREYRAQAYSHIMGRPPGALFGLTRMYYLALKYARSPRAFRERVLHGAVSGRLLDVR
jgi:glycosyltransferase involved in cell wall biosynthesis